MPGFPNNMLICINRQQQRWKGIYMVLRRLGIMVLLVVSVGLGSVVYAQDGPLSSDQLALIDRVVAARANLKGYTSFADETHGTQKETLTFSMLNQSQSFSQSLTWERIGTLVRVDGKEYAQADITATVSKAGLGPADALDYTVHAEVRVIDAVVYVKAAYVQPTPNLIDLPDGWVIVEDPANTDVYKYLQLEDLLDHPSIYDDAALLKTVVSDVEVEAQTFGDGTPRDVITLVLDRDGVAIALRESQAEGVDPAMSEMLYDSLSDDSYQQVTLVLDRANTPIEFWSAMRVEALGIDAHALAPDEFPDGIRLDMLVETTRAESYSRINEPLEPATVPDE
jgi:hypothetical protein